MIEYYDRYWEKNNKRFNDYISWKSKIIMPLVKPGSKVLDVGCGNFSVSSHLDNKCKVVGIDISGKALRSAPVGAKPILLDLNKERIPFKEESFDAVLLLDVLEHVIDPERLLEQSIKKLKKEGLLICSVPNSMNLLNRIYFLFGKPRDTTSLDDGNPFPEHIRAFSKATAEDLFSRKGLGKISEHLYFPKCPRRSKMKILGKAIYSTGLYRAFPSLLSLAFLYVLRKPSKR